MEDTKKLEEKLGAAQLREEALKAAIDDKDELIAELTAKVATSTPSVIAEKPTIPDAAFEAKDGQSYRLVVPSFVHNGKLFLAKDAIKNGELMSELIEMQSGILKKD